MTRSGTERIKSSLSPGSIIDLLRAVPRSRRRALWVLLVLMLLGALAEWVTLSSVLLFLAALSDPAGLSHVPLPGPLLNTAGSGDWDLAVWPMTIIFLLAVLLSMAIRLLLARAMSRFSFAMGRDLGVELFKRILYQPFSYHAQHNSAEVLGAVNKAHGVATCVVLPVVQAIAAGILGLGILIALLWINLPVALVAGLVLVTLYWISSRLTSRLLSRNSRIVSSGHTARMKVVQEGIGGVRDLILEGAQQPFLDQFSEIEAAFRDAQARNAFISQFPRFLIEALGIISIALLAVWISSRDDMSLVGSIPVLGALALGAQRLLPQVHQIYSSVATIRGGLGMFEDVLALLRLPIARADDSSSTFEVMPFNNSIELRSITFRYDEAHPSILKDIDLAIRKGEKIALTGQTGCGKSTLADLLMGLLEPTSGEILVDGRPLNATSAAFWQRRIAHVAQHIFLLDDSIARNIAFSASEIDRSRIQRTSSAAELDNVLKRIPDGYEARVGERGAMLSGGERQRLGIARALYKEADVLILDEATSALDDVTAIRVMRNIERIYPELTVIMVTHNPRMLEFCDRVIFLENGRLVPLKNQSARDQSAL